MGIAFSAHNANETEDHGFGPYPKRVECPACDDLSLCYANARLVFAFLALDVDPEFGEVALPVLRRAILAARARGGAERFERAEQTTHGAPRANADGTIELRPLRVHSFGLDAEGLLARVEILERIAVEATAAGATHLSWA